MNNLEKNKIYNEVVENIENNCTEWIKGWVGNVDQYNLSTKASYQGKNVLILQNAIYQKAINNEEYKNVWITFNQMKQMNFKREENNRLHLKKGSKGISLIKYVIKEQEEEQEQEQNTKEEKAQKIIPCKFTVFNISQFDGVTEEEIQELENKTFTTNIKTEEEKEQVIKNLCDSLDIKYQQVIGDRAFYSKGKDTIVLPIHQQFISNSEFLQTFLHELAHATGAKKRLNRDKKDKAKEEIIAELSSLLLYNYFDKENITKIIKNSSAYIKSWLKHLKNEKTTSAKILELFEEAKEIYEYVIDNYIKYTENIKQMA